MSRMSSLAGFQVIMSGRFWVITEVAWRSEPVSSQLVREIDRAGSPAYATRPCCPQPKVDEALAPRKVSTPAGVPSFNNFPLKISAKFAENPLSCGRRARGVSTPFFRFSRFSDFGVLSTRVESTISTKRLNEWLDRKNRFPP